MRASKTLERELSQRLRLLELAFLIARPAHADPDEAITFERIQRGADLRSHPKRLVAQIRDSLGWGLLSLFFLALLFPALLLRLVFAMECLFPEFAHVSR